MNKSFKSLLWCTSKKPSSWNLTCSILSHGLSLWQNPSMLIVLICLSSPVITFAPYGHKCLLVAWKMQHFFSDTKTAYILHHARSCITRSSTVVCAQQHYDNFRLSFPLFTITDKNSGTDSIKKKYFSAFYRILRILTSLCPA